MNLDFFGLFDYADGDGATYEYTATEFNTIIKAITGNGVMVGQGNEMEVSANGLVLTVGSGIAFAEGRIGQNKSAKTLTLDAASANRADRVVMRVDVSNRTVSFEILKGTSTTAPALTQNDLIYEIPLATINLTAGSTTVSVVDERQFIYTPGQVMEKMNAITTGTETVLARYA